jgi:hypothetical protein
MRPCRRVGVCLLVAACVVLSIRWLTKPRAWEIPLVPLGYQHVTASGSPAKVPLYTAIIAEYLRPTLGGLTPAPIVHGSGDEWYRPAGGPPRQHCDPLPPLLPSVKCEGYTNLTEPSKYLPCVDPSVPELQLCIVDDQASLREQFGVVWKQVRSSRRPLRINNGTRLARPAASGMNLFM